MSQPTINQSNPPRIDPNAPAGPAGPTGSVGPCGPPGVYGVPGPPGLPGCNGVANPGGCTGPIGPSCPGAAGIAGPPGAAGNNSHVGNVGLTGASCAGTLGGGNVTLPNGTIVTIPYTNNGWHYNITIPPMPKKEEAKAKPKDGRDGCDCAKCKYFFEFAEPNQEDGTLICWACRHGY